MDPTKKELYGAKRSSGLDVSDPTIQITIKNLKDDSSDINWILFNVTPSNSLASHSSGSNHFVGLKSNLTDDDVFYGVIKVVVSNKTKFYHIFFVGLNVTAMKKGKSSLYKSLVFSLVEAHGEVVFNNGINEFTDEYVRNEIARLSGTLISNITI